MDIRISYIVTTNSILQRGFGFHIKNNGDVFVVVTLDNGRFFAFSRTQLLAGNLYLVTGLYKADSGISIYIDGILEKGTMY